MCLAIPGKLITVDGKTGIVELGGVQRKTSLQLVPEAAAGDYVLIHAGFAIQIIDEEEAKETLELFHEYFESLEEEIGDRGGGKK
jgi:hydrogenase expression/formation protein HypC